MLVKTPQQLSEKEKQMLVYEIETAAKTIDIQYIIIQILAISILVFYNTLIGLAFSLWIIQQYVISKKNYNLVLKSLKE